MHLRLMREDAWRDEAGAWESIPELASVELWSILGYLRWHAPALAAEDPISSTFADVDSYLASRPLVAAIDRELAARSEIAAGTALVVLRALGVAPWELPPRRTSSPTGRIDIVARLAGPRAPRSPGRESRAAPRSVGRSRCRPGPVKGDATVPERHVRVVADDEVVEELDVEEAAGRQRLGREMEVVR